MADLITQASDPVLWAAIDAKWVEGEGYVLYADVTYAVARATGGTIGFLPLDNIDDLIDSRSIDGRAAQYTKLDGEL